MKKQPRYQIYRIVLSLFVWLMCLGGSAILIYLQSAHQVNNEQHKNMARARDQLDSLLTHISQSAKSIRPLIGSPCSLHTISELRRHLAITPNVGNIELAESGRVYCSSLLGEVPTGTEMRVERPLYLTTDIKSLPGHPFIMFHLQEGKYGIYTSTDGYYIRNILESASEISPIVLMTEHGWMTQDGTIHTSHFAGKKNTQIQSTVYGYMLYANIVLGNVIENALKNGSIMIVFLFSLSIAAGIYTYLVTERKISRENVLLAAMNNNEIRPYYQPIFASDPLAPIGCEILARWIKKGTIISPEKFIPLAEETGLIIQLTRQLIIDVTDQLVKHYQSERPFYISFNINAGHLQSETVETDFDYLLVHAGSNISLVIEITERELITSTEISKRNIDRLRKRGVRFALDDFGTGYSTLETLHHMPVELIKIDRLFTQGARNSDICKAIIANIIDLANRIGADIIAEGVENEGQFTLLQGLGNMAYQGYFFSEPLSWEEFRKKILI